MSNKKNDDIINIGEERPDDTFEFSQETNEEEISVQKPGVLEKRERRRGGQSESRLAVSEDADYFDIE